MIQGTLLRMDNVGIVVEDLQAAIAFFLELGMELEGETTVEGPWVDKCIGLKDAKSDIAMLRTPDGSGRLELSKFHRPAAIKSDPAPVNKLGMGRIMFAVTEIDEVVSRLQQKHGATLVDEIVQFQDMYRLCYVRGPEGLLIGLAEQLGKRTVTDHLRDERST